MHGHEPSNEYEDDKGSENKHEEEAEDKRKCGHKIWVQEKQWGEG